MRRSLCLALLFTGAVVPGAKADFVSPYALSDFTLVNSSFANGFANTPDGGHSVVLTGPNDGSGLPGYTELTVASRGTGVFRFDYLYTSLDLPGADFAGYLVNGHLFPLATTIQSGSVSIPVHTGDRIGFRIDTVDNIAEPGVLSISNFSAPTAIPSPVPASSTATVWILVLLLSCSSFLLIKRGTTV